ncbi:SocA family protein [Candidatus Saccharibacteria bacterium]|nr:SocA family protein [Candidatus Saccharibacteria bacterium]
MGEKTKYTANDIAGWFINRSNQIKIDEKAVEGITNLKLQKIVFLAQAASLALNKKPLFDDQIQAWQYGPVIPAIYDKYKNHKNNTIPKPRGKIREIDEDTKKLLETVWEFFGGYSASQLVKITHSHQPWIEAYNDGQGAFSEISQKSIQAFYQNIFSRV